MEKWRWEKPSGGVLTDGALEDLFKAEPRKAPGHLSVNPPGDSATLLAREAIQNSWDSAIERADHASDRRMAIEFKFDRLPAADTRRLIDTLGLEELKRRLELVGDWKTVQLHNADAFRFIEQGASLEILTVTETGTTGMYGPWDPQAMVTSKMILALLSVGISQHDEKSQRGGSFGHGKAGLLSASATRTVVAYSCFNDDEHLSGATRRLYGMTYWKSHGIENQRFLGFGHFGDQRNENENETFPFEDAEADRVAQELGLGIRNPDDPDGIGTTFLLIEPVVEPEDLKVAVERNWWPALVQYEDLVIDIVDQAGTDHSPAPKANQDLRPYIRAFEIARQAENATLKDDCEKFSRPRDVELIRYGKRPTAIGRLGLVADPDGWSFPAEDGTDHRSLVALIRGPRMVTEYFNAANGSVRQVRGVFIADDLVDSLLKSTEPHQHDRWSEEKGMGGVEDEAPEVAEKIHNHVRSQAENLRRALKISPPPSGEYHLPELDKIMQEIYGEKGKTPPKLPKKPPRLVHIEPRHSEKTHKSGRGKLHMTAVLTFSLTELAKTEKYKPLLEGERLPTRIIVSYQFDEDGRVGSSEDSYAKLSLTSKLRGSFKVTNDSSGSLIIDGPVGDDEELIEVKSDPYDSDYTGQIKFGFGPIPKSDPNTESVDSDG